MKAITVDSVLAIINESPKLKIRPSQIKDNLTGLGMDSITFIQIIVRLEEVFDCEIPDEKLLIGEMDTVQKILDVLQELYKNK